MRYVIILILGALLSTTIFGQTPEDPRYASQIRSFVIDFKKRMGKPWELQVTLKTGERMVGILTTVGEQDFGIRVANQSTNINYSNVDSIGTYWPKSDKDTGWKRVGRGLQTSFAVAAIGTILLVTYPATALAERGANAKAKSLEKEIATSLPLGTSKSQVISFLDSRKIKHAEVKFSKPNLAQPGTGQLNVKINQVSASIARGSGIYVQMTFDFDDADRLIEHKGVVLEDSL